MTLTIDLSSEVNERLRQEAERRGLAIEEFARRLMRDGSRRQGPGR